MKNKYDAYIFDLDGTVYKGDSLIPGADEVINQLTDEGKKVLFLSNKTTGTANDYCSFLNNAGIKAVPGDIITSTKVIKSFLSENFAESCFYAIGEDVFINEITDAGLYFSADPKKIKIIIITLDRTFHYEKMEIAARALENGARFFAANIDKTCPVDGGEITDAGIIISALEKRTGRRLEINFGKPSPLMIEEIQKRIAGIPKEKILLVGDRLETDILMGNIMGINTALVSTGIKNDMEMILITPTYLFDTIADLKIEAVKTA